jgi:WXG100 family type VII secretion target
MASPSPAPTPTPSPGPSPTPPRIHRSFNVWNPGGDPGAIRQAAAAWRTLAGDLRTAQHDVEQQVSSLRSGWTGKASDAFQHWGTQLGTDIADSAGQCDRIAGQLDQVADKIQSTNDEIHGLIVAMGVTAAVGIGLTIFTLGFSDAAAAGAATAEATEAATLVTILTNFLEGLLGRWVVAFAINLFATGVEKAWINPNHDPFDGWTPDDITHAVYGADALVVATPIADAIPGFSAFRSAHPFIAAGTVSGTAAGVSAFGSDLSALAFEGKPLGLGTLVDVGISAGVSGLVSGTAEYGAARFVGRPDPILRGPRLVSTETGLAEPGLTLGDAPTMEVAAGGELRPIAPPPEGWTRSAGGLLVPKGTGEVTVGDQTFRVQDPQGGPTEIGQARAETPGLRVEQTPGGPGLVRATPEGPPGVSVGDQTFRPQGPGQSGLVEAKAQVPGEVRIGGQTYRIEGPREDPSGPLIAKAKLPTQPGIAPDQWEGHGPGGLTLPKDEAVRTSMGVTVEQPRVGPLRQLWISSRQLRKSSFKLNLKGGSNTALNPFASGTAPAPPSFPGHPVTTPGQAPAPPPPPPRPPVVGGGTYRVRPGDNLWTIAQRTYGNGELWQAIYRANMRVGHDPNLIHVGDLIHLPPVVKPAA